MMKCTLCIIEDDPVTVFGLRKLLAKTDYIEHLEVFEDGQSAIENLRPHLEKETEFTPDVIFLDLNMPVMDGWQFIEEYTAIERPPKSDPILLYVVSSSIRDADAERARNYSEVSGYIVKPITLDNLKEVFESDIKKYKKG